MRKSNLSEAQREVLESYARGEPKRRGTANFTLRMRGLLEFVWRSKLDGELIPSDEVGAYRYDQIEFSHEQITLAGRALIAQGGGE